MEKNKTYFGSDARNKLKVGVDTIFNSTAPTLSANGRNVCYMKWGMIPYISNDGVSIARKVNPENFVERMGADLIKQVSEQTNADAGDGTTTSIILAHSMIEEGMKLIDAEGSKVNPMQLRREMEAASIKVIDALKDRATKVTSLEDLIKIATISVEDPAIGKLIATAIEEAGANGSVYVEESTKPGITVEKIEGYDFPQGAISPGMITNFDKLETVMENPVILVTERPLFWNTALQQFFDTVLQMGKRNILIIADEVHEDVIRFAATNTQNKKFTCVIVKKPMQAEFIEDIAKITGATAITKEKNFINPKPEYLGTARKVVVKRDKSTTIIGGAISPEALAEYVEALKTQVKDAEPEDPAVGKMTERIAKITGGIQMLNVGSAIESELKYLKMKVEDAINATKAAKEEGFVAGGGSALMHIAYEVFGGVEKNDGEKVVVAACSAPYSQILYNSGEKGDTMFDVSQKNSGYDALKHEFVSDVIERGIIDPVKVTRSAFKNASKLAGLFLTTECVVEDLPEKGAFDR